MKEKGRKNVLDRGSACKDQAWLTGRKKVDGMSGSQAVWEPVVREQVSLRQVIMEARMRWD